MTACTGIEHDKWHSTARDCDEHLARIEAQRQMDAQSFSLFWMPALQNREASRV